jgi:hypothetical protein
LLFHWTAEHCLAMPAIRFFALLASGRKLQAKRDGWLTVLKLDAASVSLGDGKYYDEMRKFYLKQAFGEEATRSNALDATDPKTGALVADLFKQAERFL